MRLLQVTRNLIQGLCLPDPDDRHGLAAAIRGRVDVIVTRSTKHFPDDALKPFGIVAQHPDEFVVHLLDNSRGILEMLEQEGLTETVATLREYMTGE